MVKTKVLLSDLENAVAKLEEATLLPPDVEINRDGTIQRFEFTFELSWKLMKAIEDDQGVEAYGVKTIIREAAKLGLIDDPLVWFEYLKARNLASHTYNQTISMEVYNSAKNFISVVKAFITKAKKYLAK